MASLNLLQWRQQSLWQRYRALHSLGILLILAVIFFSVQWVASYSDYLNHLTQQINHQKRALEEHKHQQQRWSAYQQKRKLQQDFKQRKHTDQRRLSAFYALLDKTQKTFHQRELLISHSQFKLTAEYQQIQDVNEQYLWLEQQLVTAEVKQQLLPQQRVLFYYTGHSSETGHNG